MDFTMNSCLVGKAQYEIRWIFSSLEAKCQLLEGAEFDLLLLHLLAVLFKTVQDSPFTAGRK